MTMRPPGSVAALVGLCLAAITLPACKAGSGGGPEPVAAPSGGGVAPLTAYLPTVENTTGPPGPAPDGMAWIPGGEVSMGSDAPGEAPCARPGGTPDAQTTH